jgi:hypothetical protein
MVALSSGTSGVLGTYDEDIVAPMIRGVVKKLANQDKIDSV